jgi:AAA+ ATPase superfamily predicted ATPase
MFVDREDELATLRRWWDNEQRVALLWGRRRVGKTTLLQHFAENRRTVFHFGAGRPRNGELAQLSREMMSVAPTQSRDLLASPYIDWDDALENLAHVAREKPLLLVFDEFAELLRGSPELPGVLRAFLDRSGSRTRLQIVLCGNAVREMEALLEPRAPLSGRFDLTLHVQRFRPHEAAMMLPGLPAEQQALVYGILGGVPLYLSWWDTNSGVADNLRRLLCQPGAPLLTEGLQIVSTEAQTGVHPSAVLHAIASGHTRYEQIKDAVRTEPGRVLDLLIQSRVIERIAPVTDHQRSNQVRYRICDDFLAFYLQVVSRYRAEIERGLGESILGVMLSELDDYMGPRWGDMFRTYLRRLAVAGSIDQGVVAVGPWWDGASEVELDAVMLAGRTRVPILAGDATWAKTIDPRHVLARLRAKAAAVPGADPDTLTFAVCARRRPRSTPEGMLTVAPEDVLG